MSEEADRPDVPNEDVPDETEQGAYTPHGGSLTGARVAGVALLLFGLVVSYQTVGIIRQGGAAPDSPGFFPLIVSIGLVVFGLVFLLEAFFRPDDALREAVSDEDEKTDWRKFGLLLLALLLYVFLLAPLGYIVATTLFFVGAAWVMGSRKVVRDLVVGLAFSAAIYFGFTELLSVRLPAGIFPGGLI